MTENSKRKAIFFFYLAVIIVVLIAAALPQFELHRGVPLPFMQTTPNPAGPEVDPPVSISISTFLKAALAVFLIAALAFTIYKILRKMPWKQYMVQLLVIAGVTLVVTAILILLTNLKLTINPSIPEELPVQIDLPRGEAGPVSPDFFWLAAFALAAAVIGLGVWLVVRQSRRVVGEDALQLEAERALESLRGGLDLKNVIIECYLRMSRALQKEQGIKLEESMTAREFESLLDKRGFPGAPVHQLTQLFEQARYGIRPPAAGDEQKALECLDAIVQYCRQVRKAV